MNQLSAPHRAIRNKLNPAQLRRGLVVEGADDVVFVERFLDVKFAGNWRQSWLVGPAEGKGRLLEILALEPTWLGLVDTDEWAQTTIAQMANTQPRCHFLPRYCMESYFIVPGELWALLPQNQQNQIAGGSAALEAAITTPVPQWLRHGALWRVVNPLWAGLIERGFKNDLLDLANAQNDAFIQSKLAEWHNHLDPQQRFSEFQVELQQAQELPMDQKLKRIIHGKSFFKEHVCPTLNGLLGQKSAADWLADLTKVFPDNDELNALWTAMQLM